MYGGMDTYLKEYSRPMHDSLYPQHAQSKTEESTPIKRTEEARFALTTAMLLAPKVLKIFFAWMVLTP